MEMPKRIRKLGISISKYKTLLETPTILPHDCYYRTLDSVINTDCHRKSLSTFSIQIPSIMFDLPYPIYPPVQYDKMQDPCLDYYNMRAQLKEMIDRRRSQYNEDKSWLNKDYIKSDKVVLPEYLVEIGKLITELDSYCNANYDQYYVGGILCKGEFNEDMHLIRPINTNVICISSIENSDQCHFMKAKNSRIYNLQMYKNELCIRQKNNLSYVHIDIEEESLNVKTLWKKESIIPYIDFKPMTKEVSTLTLDYNLKTYDVETKQEITNQTFPLESKEFDLGQFEYVDQNKILFMGRSEVHLFDKQSLEIKSKLIVDSNHLICNELYSFILSKTNTKYAYLITKHDILMFDWEEMKIVKCWTHFLDHYPISCKSEIIGNDEYLCVNNFREVIMLQISGNENYLPFKIPHILETFELYNLRNGVVLNEKLKKRFEFCIAGIETYHKPNSNDMKVFSVNSIGDIFCNNSSFTMKKKNKSMPVMELTPWINLFSNNVKELVVNAVEYLGNVKSLIGSPEDDSSLNLDLYIDDNEEAIEKLNNSIDVSKFALGEIWIDEDYGPKKKKKVSEISDN